MSNSLAMTDPGSPGQIPDSINISLGDTGEHPVDFLVLGWPWGWRNLFTTLLKELSAGSCLGLSWYFFLKLCLTYVTDSVFAHSITIQASCFFSIGQSLLLEDWLVRIWNKKQWQTLKMALISVHCLCSIAAHVLVIQSSSIKCPIHRNNLTAIRPLKTNNKPV